MKLLQSTSVLLVAVAVGLVGCQNSAEQFPKNTTQNKVQIQQAQEEDITPNRGNVKNKVHVKKIRELKQDHASVDKYLEKLSTKELLETAAELAEESTFAVDDNGPVLVPHLKKRWAKGIPYQQLNKQVKDKSFHKKYRMYLIDVEANLSETVPPDTVTESLLDVGHDPAEDAMVRRYALLNIRHLVKDKVRKAKQDQSLYEISKDNSAPDEVRGASVTAMRRTKNPHFKELTDEVIKNPNAYSKLLVRHALSERAKSHESVDVRKIKEIAAATEYEEVYATAIYALGIEKGPESVQAIVSLYGRFGNEDIGRYALQENQMVIVRMLQESASTEHVSSAIQAARLIRLPSAEEPLRWLAQNSQDPLIQRQSDLALQELLHAPPSMIPQKMEE